MEAYETNTTMSYTNPLDYKDSYNDIPSTSAYSSPYNSPPHLEPSGYNCLPVKCEPWEQQQLNYLNHQFYPRQFPAHRLPSYNNNNNNNNWAHDFYNQQTLSGPSNNIPSHPTDVKSEIPFYNDHPSVSGTPNIPSSPNEIKPSVTLENDDLWRDFHKVGTEMVITKTGR